MSDYRKPLPLPDEDTWPYWQACREHRLMMQRCDDCGTVRFRPNLVCPRCLSEAATWVELSGRGTVWSFIVVHQPMVPGFGPDDVPYAVACVELAEGPRITTNIVDCPLDQIRIGMPVTVVWDDVTPEVTLPKFRPVGQAS